MTAPPLVVNAGGRRFYKHPVTGELYSSVTSAIGVMDKPALVGWAARETAKAAWRERAAIPHVRSERALVDMLKNARYETVTRAADLGSEIHAVCEALWRDEPLPSFQPEAEPYIDSFMRFVSDFDPEWVLVECTVFNDRYRYAGTFDAVMRLDRFLVMLDHKTGRGVYEEVALQLAALRFAEHIWSRSTGELEPLPHVDACLAVHLRQDGYSAYHIAADQAAFDCFLGLHQALPWAKGGKDGAVGPAMNRTRLLRALDVTENSQPLTQPQLEVIP